MSSRSKRFLFNINNGPASGFAPLSATDRQKAQELSPFHRAGQFPLLFGRDA